MLAKKLENELKCGICKDYFHVARILNCGHSVCEKCGHEKIEKCSKIKKTITSSKSSCVMSTFQQRKTDSNSSEKSVVESEQDAMSESDSGIFVSHASNGSLGSESAFMSSMSQPGATLKLSQQHLQVVCPVCFSPSLLAHNSSSMDNFPCNTVLQSIVTRYQQENGLPTNGPIEQYQHCQLCDETQVKEAVVFCEQCQVFYCLSCRDKCHPMRGPLERHSLVTVASGAGAGSSKTLDCAYHKDERLDYFCEECGQLICQQCKGGQHFRHPLVPVAVHTKNAKVSLSKSLQRISGKVISGSEFIQSLKVNMGLFKAEHDDFVKEVDESFNKIIEVIESKRRHCHQQAKLELERKERMINEQLKEGSMLISQTTSMIHLAVEIIKESNSTEFCKISDQILKRALNTEKNLLQNLNELKPKCNKKMELKLDNEALMKEINSLDLKTFKCPESPKFIVERCSVWDNLINVVWHPVGPTEVDKYLLDIDDGAGGQFKTAYCGPESMCTIENLHFGGNYRLRIKAVNKAGVSHYGDVIRLMTSTIAKFHMLPCVGIKKNGINLSLSGMVIESSPANTEDTVFMASTGFTKGIHYWEYKVEYYDGVGEPSFGIAMENCAKNKRLGSDVFSWGMYMNSKRSWFQHNSEHTERTDVQLCQGLRIGIRLDLDHQKLSYFINDQPHGPIAFSQLLVASSRSYNQLINSPQTSGSNHSLNDSCSKSRMLYPAVSISHGIKLSLVSGLPPPSDDSCSEEEEDITEIMTPSLSKRMDVSYLLKDLTESSDGSFKELAL